LKNDETSLCAVFFRRGTELVSSFFTQKNHLKRRQFQKGTRYTGLEGLSESGHLTEAPQGQAWPLSDVLSRPFFRSNSELLDWAAQAIPPEEKNESGSEPGSETIE
jgi:hypothetical protein